MYSHITQEVLSIRRWYNWAWDNENSNNRAKKQRRRSNNKKHMKRNKKKSFLRIFPLTLVHSLEKRFILKNQIKSSKSL